MMKKSNLILVCGLLAVSFFFLAFQSIMHSYMEEDYAKEKAIKFVTETRNILDFRKISVGDGILVFFKQDTTMQLKIEASENMITYVKTEVLQEELVIKKTEGMRDRDTAKVYISNHRLDELKVTSGAYFETTGEVSGKNLKLEFNDDSKGNLKLSYELVTCKASSGSKVNIKGDSNQIDFSN